MADYELIGLNEAAPDLRAPTSADRGIVAGGVRVVGLTELDGGADINGDPVATVSRTNPLSQAIRVAMTAAASGSTGIQVPDDPDIDIGTNNFTVHWEGSLPDWTPAALVRVLYKFQNSSNRYTFQVNTNGTLLVFVASGGVTLINASSTVATGLTDGSYAKITASVIRETATAAGSVTFYVNGVQLGTAVSITAAATVNADNSGLLYISGDNTLRYASDNLNSILYNRALSAAEVLSLCVNGPALADIGASQVPVAITNPSFEADTGTATTGGSTISGWEIFASGSAAAVVEATAPSGSNVIRFTAADGNSVLRTDILGALTTSKTFLLKFWARSVSGSTSLSPHRVPTSGYVSFPYTTITSSWVYYELVVPSVLVAGSPFSRAFYFNLAGAGVCEIDLVSANQIGITGQWSAENAQSNTGQIFDSSGNKNHALLPADGATIIGKPVSGIRQVRWTNTWAGTNELQYIGGVNQNILPANAYIDSIVGTVSGATPHDIIIGDGSDTDRYVTITTGLATGTTTFTLANRTTDGTNLKLTVDPDTNCTMSIAWVISYRILE